MEKSRALLKFLLLSRLPGTKVLKAKTGFWLGKHLPLLQATWEVSFLFHQGLQAHLVPTVQILVMWSQWKQAYL